MQRLHSVLVAATVFAAGILVLGTHQAAAQQVFVNGESSRLLSADLVFPLELDIDATGNVYVASGFYPSAVDIFRYTVDGRVETFTNPIDDPDSLAVDAAGYVYVGSYGGRITRIDPVTGGQETWLLDGAIGNIDGMHFAPSGDLLVVSIDRGAVYRIAVPSRQVTVFADLSSLGVTGMTGVTVHPATGHFYVGSPWQNVIVELDESGAIIDPSVASGFQFLGHLAFDLSGLRPLDLWAADNGSAAVYRIDLATRQVTQVVRYIDPHVGGLVFGHDGGLFYDRTSNDDSVGELHWLAPMSITFVGTRLPGATLDTTLKSPADRYRPFLLLLGGGATGYTFADGRHFPLDRPLSLLLASSLDDKGEFSFGLPLPGDPGLSGATFYLAFITRDRATWGPVGISEAAVLEIQ
ncbi:MAG: hypothetical protein AB1486_24690 [Planctomycetota bacterium]